MKCLIVTGGNTSDDFACEVIKKGGYEIIIAADSGMEFLYRKGIDPDIIVGDFDSVDEEILDSFREKEYIEICMLPTEKDDTDTEHAVREAIERGARSITILGATGTRLDHVLGNIALLGIGLLEKVEIELLDPYNRVRMFDHPVKLLKKKQFGSYLSILPYTGTVTGLTVTGMKYPLSDYTMDAYSSRGVSNEITGDEATIDFREGVLLLIESRD